MITSMLIIHLLGAIITFILIGFAISAMLKNNSSDYPFYVKSIALLGGYDLISGSLLTIVSSHQSALVFCGRIALYVALLAGIEIALYFKMKGIAVFPKKALAYSSVLSSFFIVAALVTTL